MYFDVADDWTSWIFGDGPLFSLRVLAESLEMHFVMQKGPSTGTAEDKQSSAEQSNQNKKGVMRNLLHELLVRFSSNNRKVINHFHAADEERSDDADDSGYDADDSGFLSDVVCAVKELL